MIGELFDSLVGAFNPQAGVKRVHARGVMRRLKRGYAGAETNRLNANKKPLNQSADAELAGPMGADRMRAWARLLVRDNAYAWGVVDTIVSSVVGCGIQALSMVETPDGDDVETVNEQRDAVWEHWCKVCDINGQYTFEEIQAIAQREIVEAGEVLIHVMTVPVIHKGIMRPVPLALELIEADRLASDHDTHAYSRSSGNRVVRGVEMDELGKPVAYWVYPNHPNAASPMSRTPERKLAADIIHLFRRDRIGQSRGVSWFAPVLSWLRDLGLYVENEMQSSAVASCVTGWIKSNGSPGGLIPPTDTETTDTDGNTYDYFQPGMIGRLNTDEDIVFNNPGRPNSSAEPWINLMLRGIAVGTGLSYSRVSRDYSQAAWSSERSSDLEDRRRFRCWQDYLISHLCHPVRHRFHQAAASIGRGEFPTATELLSNPETAAPVEFMATGWEWVNPVDELTASRDSIGGLLSTYQDEYAKKGGHFKYKFYQIRKEQRMIKRLGIATPDQASAPQPIDAAIEQTVEKTVEKYLRALSRRQEAVNAA